MFLRIEASSAVPIYRQVMDQIRESIACGLLKPGEQMPSVRQLADELAVNQNTILKVYNELCRDGVLKTERGSGTFVADSSQQVQDREKMEIVTEAIGQAADKGLRMQIELQTLHDLLDSEYQKRKAGEQS